ncbi:MAG TPA: hypothetical protein VGF28_02800 [Thermoanaerobaculia bacterium]
MRIDDSPDYAALAFALVFAAVFFTAAVVITTRRRARGLRPGPAVWLFLVLAGMALAGAWDAVFPTCPRGWWC